MFFSSFYSLTFTASYINSVLFGLFLGRRVGTPFDTQGLDLTQHSMITPDTI